MQEDPGHIQRRFLEDHEGIEDGCIGLGTRHLTGESGAGWRGNLRGRGGRSMRRSDGSGLGEGKYGSTQYPDRLYDSVHSRSWSVHRGQPSRGLGLISASCCSVTGQRSESGNLWKPISRSEPLQQ